MKIVALSVADQNAALLDPWSLIHLSAGLFAGLVGIPAVPSMIGAVGYEVFEQVAERQPWGQHIFRTSGSETGVNIAIDILAFAAGWYMGDRYHTAGDPAVVANPRPVSPRRGRRAPRRRR